MRQDWRTVFRADVGYFLRKKPVKRLSKKVPRDCYYSECQNCESQGYPSDSNYQLQSIVVRNPHRKRPEVEGVVVDQSWIRERCISESESPDKVHSRERDG